MFSIVFKCDICILKDYILVKLTKTSNTKLTPADDVKYNILIPILL